MLIRLWLNLPSCDAIRAMIIREKDYDAMIHFLQLHGGRIVGVELANPESAAIAA